MILLRCEFHLFYHITRIYLYEHLFLLNTTNPSVSYLHLPHNCTNIAICRQFAWQMVSSQCPDTGIQPFHNHQNVVF
ncbi:MULTISPECIES: hypothetical protein [Wolbachia]|uniref:hypothetical protein n=1 Tax=Wolbachia TaxID=953 RepID=UPI001E5E6E65|nr:MULTISPECIES: hypothetical protein [Wolbachia]MDE5056379.1 hypothetical protein [Wolbachia endosymbiont of Drosophila bicornuta]MDE5058558.1 hypothetical protein [Wolbachia endosymbiont of Drosophila baimaii]